MSLTPRLLVHLYRGWQQCHQKHDLNTWPPSSSSSSSSSSRSSSSSSSSSSYRSGIGSGTSSNRSAPWSSSLYDQDFVMR